MDFQRRTSKSLFCPLSSVFFTTNLLKKLRTFAAVQTERGTKKVKIRESDFSLEFPPPGIYGGRTMEKESIGHVHHGHEDHHHHHHVPTSVNGIFILCIALNLLFVAIEAGVGFVYGSVGLLSDAGHNLSDVFSLLIALLAIRMAARKSTEKFTYGYKKSTVLASLLNAVILLVAVGAIIIESISRLNHPQEVSGAAISWTAGIGILINGFTAWLLMRDQDKDLNVKGAFLHMAMDTLVSAGVVVSGIVIYFTGILWIDPAISLVIAAIILVSTFNMLKESLFLSLDAVPEAVDMDAIGKGLKGIDGVTGWHHIHVWAMSTTENAATVHLVLKDISSMEEVKDKARAVFRSAGVEHCTIECEAPGSHCPARDCC